MDFARSPGPAIIGLPARDTPSIEDLRQEEIPELPPLLGPADRHRSSDPGPFEVEAPGIDVAALAADLRWRRP